VFPEASCKVASASLIYCVIALARVYRFLTGAALIARAAPFFSALWHRFVTGVP